MEQLTPDLTVYVLVRTDLPSLNSGKGMAQVHHSGVQMMAKHNLHMLVQQYIQTGVAQGADHFNTTIVKGARLDQITSILDQAAGHLKSEIVFDHIVDPEYPFLVQNHEVADLIPETVAQAVKQIPNGNILMVRRELTCAWFLGSTSNPQFHMLFDQLDLHP